MFANAVFHLVLLLICGAEFGTTYEIFPFRIPDSDITIQKGEGIDMEHKLPITYSSSPNAVHYDDTVPNSIPFSEEGKLDSNNMYPMVPPSLHPLFYGGAHASRLHQFPAAMLDGANYAAEPFRTDYSYTHYGPPPQSFPPANSYGMEEIQYVPLVPEMSFYKPGQGGTQRPSTSTQRPSTSTLPPLPYLSMTTSSSLSSSTGFEEDMVKRIMQIVNDFRKFNMTQTERPASREDAASPITKIEPTTLIAVTTVEETNEESNKTELESIVDLSTNESQTKIHTSGDRTESPQVVQLVQVDPDQNIDVTSSPSTLIVKPYRYVLAQFIDPSGNPCAKEFVMASNKKSYYVYTCEERTIPSTQTTTSSDASVIHYKNELPTTRQDMNVESPDLVTTPMTADGQTLPETLNDYMVYNKE